MANEQNLQPVRTKKEARERGRNGGIKSGEVRARKKTLKEELELLLEKMEDGQTNQERMSVALFKEAFKGNTKAFEIIRDTVGEKPKDVIDANVNTEIKVTLEDD